jgi:multiple sugar transport system permease protein
MTSRDLLSGDATHSPKYHSRAIRPGGFPIRAAKLNYHKKLQLTGFLFVAPALAFFAAFCLYPMLKAMQVSLYDWDLVSPMKFVGLRNYIEALGSSDVRDAFKATFQYIALASPLSWFLGFFLAVTLNDKFPGRDFFRTFFFIPAVFPIIGLALAWWVMYQPNGLINNLLGMNIPWMTRIRYAMPGLAMMDIWRATGYYMVLFLVGLQSIPHEYYEAARIDGANAFQLLTYITVPLLRPVFAFVAIVGIIWGVQILIPMFVMTRGGPGNATTSLVLMIYRKGMIEWRMGFASAISVLLFLLIMVLTVVQLRFFRVGREEEVA